MEIKNAKITQTFLGREDHGILTFFIFVEFSGCGCGIGGYCLDSYDIDTRTRIYSAKSMEAISNILDVVGVDSWEELEGKYIRIKEQGLGSGIDEIGNLMEDKWFNIREFFNDENDEFD